MDKHAPDQQALRLLNAFMSIEDASMRETLVSLAEAAAEGATFEIHHRLEEQQPPDLLN